MKPDYKKKKESGICVNGSCNNPSEHGIYCYRHKIERNIVRQMMIPVIKDLGFDLDTKGNKISYKGLVRQKATPEEIEKIKMQERGFRAFLFSKHALPVAESIRKSIRPLMYSRKAIEFGDEQQAPQRRSSPRNSGIYRREHMNMQIRFTKYLRDAGICVTTEENFIDAYIRLSMLTFACEFKEKLDKSNYESAIGHLVTWIDKHPNDLGVIVSREALHSNDLERLRLRGYSLVIESQKGYYFQCCALGHDPLQRILQKELDKSDQSMLSST